MHQRNYATKIKHLSLQRKTKKKMKKHFPFIARIVISLLFLLSGIAKMFPIWAFEKQLVDLDICTWCTAPYAARIIIAIEIAIAFAILQGNYLKKFVIPFTILLLIVFNLHLTTEMYKHGAMNGNCGCFGQLIPMTPLEAFIKNIVAIALLIYIFKNVTDKEPGSNKPIYLLTIYLASTLLLFIAFPFCPCDKVTTAVQPYFEEILPETTNSDTILVSDTTKKDQSLKNMPLIDTTKDLKKVEVGPKKVKSKFSKYSRFGNKTVDLSDGKKILCLFVPGCDHCRDAAKEISIMSKKPGFPEVYILFMDEEAELIPEFLNVTKSAFPYQVINIPEFWKTLGNDANTPGVVYLNNGNILKFYEGTEANKFNADGLLKAIESK